MKIYCVVATEGEYSDYSEWIVVGYKDKSEAEKHITLANDWIKNNPSNYSNQRKDKRSPYDPILSYHYNPRYILQEIDYLTNIEDFKTHHPELKGE